MGDSWRPIYWKDQHLDEMVCIGQIHVETGEISPPWHFAPTKGAAVIPDEADAEVAQCEYCGGSGKGYYWWEVCDVCKGSGKAIPGEAT